MKKAIKPEPTIPYSKQLYEYFVKDFDRQPATDDVSAIIQQNQFPNIKGINASYLATAFKYSREREKKSIEKDVEKENKCEAVLESLKAAFISKRLYWKEVGEGKLLFENKAETIEESPLKMAAYFSDMPEDIIKNYTIHEDNKSFKLLDTWIPNIFDFTDQDDEQTEIVKKFFHNQDKKIQLLVLDPTGKSFELRSKATLKNDKSLIKLKEKAIERIKKLFEYTEKNKKLEIKLFDEYPTINAFIFDKYIYFGYYLSFNYTTNTSFFRIENNKNTLSTDIEDHFKAIWNRETSVVVDLPKLEELEELISLERSLFTDINGKTFKVFFPRNTLMQNNEGEQNPNEEIFVGTSEDDILVYTIKIESDTHTSMKAIWTFVEDGVETKIEGLVHSIHEHFFRCQLVKGDYTLNVVMPTTLKKSDEPQWIIYSTIHHEKSYCGTTIAVSLPRNPAKFVHKDERQWISEVKKKIVTRNQDFWSPINIYKKLHSEASKLSEFKGVYQTHSYGRKSQKDVMITSNILEIDDFGRVQFFRKTGKVEAYGYAFFEGGNLYIDLLSSEKQRRCQFVFCTRKNFPDEGRLYSGIYVGLSQHYEYPLGLRVVAQYLGKDRTPEMQPSRHVLNSPGYDALLSGLKATLTGRFENFISFPRRNGANFSNENLENEAGESHKNNSLAELLYKAACFDAQIGDIPKAVHGIKRAYNHGFTDFNSFEGFIQNLKNGKEVLKSITEHNDYLKLKQLYHTAKLGTI